MRNARIFARGIDDIAKQECQSRRASIHPGLSGWYRAPPLHSQSLVCAWERGSDGQQHRRARVALPLGLLVYRSRFLPRVIGIWLMMGCFVWLAFSLTALLFPGQEDKIFTYGQPVMFGEVAIMLWLVIVGAKERPLPTSVPAQ